MVLEAFRIPRQLIRQERDWSNLIQTLPQLSEFAEKQAAIEEKLGSAHCEYLAAYSSPLISLSLNRAAFLFFIAQNLRAEKVLDLGSGFSSYVLRKCAAEANRGVVTSVDDSVEWLSVTKSFLQGHGLPTENLIDLKSFRAADGSFHCPDFDLCIIDIGDFDLRKTLLPKLIEKTIANESILLLDDFHVRNYRQFIIDLCSDKSVQLFSLRKMTRRRLSHMALVSGKRAYNMP
jgi:predicted O-methyltransferase YrrM